MGTGIGVGGGVSKVTNGTRRYQFRYLTPPRNCDRLLDDYFLRNFSLYFLALIGPSLSAISFHR